MHKVTLRHNIRDVFTEPRYFIPKSDYSGISYANDYSATLTAR